jgi:hypothetical protein
MRSTELFLKVLQSFSCLYIAKLLFFAVLQLEDVRIQALRSLELTLLIRLSISRLAACPELGCDSARGSLAALEVLGPAILSSWSESETRTALALLEVSAWAPPPQVSGTSGGWGWWTTCPSLWIRLGFSKQPCWGA